MPTPGALSDLRILELSRIMAGPWCGQLLADLGAEVIKVERPGRGDDTRAWGPPFLAGTDGEATAESAYYLSANRGKRSIAVDFASDEGRALVARLADASDVLIENFKVGTLARHGLDYDSLAVRNPRLIYCSVTGFGQSGPYANRAGYDFMIQAMGGLMSVTGPGAGAPGDGPCKVGVPIADLMAGMYAAVGILAALAHRERSGRGQHIDVSLLDTQVAMLANQAMNYLVSGTPPARLGNAHPNIVPYQAFPAADGQIALAIGNDRQFQRFCDVAGCAELARDPRFATNADRVRHRDALVALLEEVTRNRRAQEWVGLLEAAGIPCGPVNDLEAVFADPQVRARGLRQELAHPLSGTLPVVGPPLRLSRTPAAAGAAPPLLGEHTNAVLAEVLGLEHSELEQLRAAGVIA